MRPPELVFTNLRQERPLSAQDGTTRHARTPLSAAHIGLQITAAGCSVSPMQWAARIMLVLFAVLTISGHDLAPSFVYHADAHAHDAALHDTADSHNHGQHDHHASGIVIAVNSASDTLPSDCGDGHCNAEHSGAHVHVSCCGTVMALPSVYGWIAPSTVTEVDLPLGIASLALGELRYPLLRPPRRLT